MPKNYVITAGAQKDRRDILRYIGHDNPAAAQRMNDLFYDAFQKLGTNSSMGQVRGDLTALPLRFWPVHHNYMIVYDT